MSQILLILDALRAGKQTSKAVHEHRRSRVNDLVGFARAHSPFFREYYKDVRTGEVALEMLPVTSKKQLMTRFDDWTTDRAIRLSDVQALVDDPKRIGERYLGRYTVATTSGTTGVRGIFVLDDHTMAVTNAIAVRMLTSWLSFRDFARIVVRGGRMAMVMATGGHFASAVAAARLRRGRSRSRIGVFPAHTPMPRLVDQLNQFQPVLLAPYASLGSLLASEQEAGRLHIRPVLITVSAEGLPQAEYERIARVFAAKVGNSYAATECTFLSYNCREGWLHVNADWAILEPVDAEHRPVPPGVQSHTVLLTNLANRVQPIIRYDLGDGVLQRVDACPCGNRMPAIKVTGRSADVLTFATASGGTKSLPPQAFGLILDSMPGVEQAQVVQVEADRVRLRLRMAGAGDAEQVWQRALASVKDLMVRNGLENVAVDRAEERPEQTPGGKFREVVPLAAEKRGK